MSERRGAETAEKRRERQETRNTFPPRPSAPSASVRSLGFISHFRFLRTLGNRLLDSLLARARLQRAEQSVGRDRQLVDA